MKSSELISKNEKLFEYLHSNSIEKLSGNYSPQILTLFFQEIFKFDNSEQINNAFYQISEIVDKNPETIELLQPDHFIFFISSLQSNELIEATLSLLYKISLNIEKYVNICSFLSELPFFHVFLDVFQNHLSPFNESILENLLVISGNFIMQNQQLQDLAFTQGFIPFLLDFNPMIQSENTCSISMIQSYINILSAYISHPCNHDIEIAIYHIFFQYLQISNEEISIQILKGYKYSLQWSSSNIYPFIIYSGLIPILCEFTVHQITSLRKNSLKLLIFAGNFDHNVFQILSDFKEEEKIQAILSLDENKSCSYALKLIKNWIKSGIAMNYLIEIIQNLDIFTLFQNKEFKVKKQFLNFLLFFIEKFEGSSAELFNDEFVSFLMDLANSGDPKICSKILLIWRNLKNVKNQQIDYESQIIYLAHLLQENEGFQEIINNLNENHDGINEFRFNSLYNEFISSLSIE